MVKKKKQKQYHETDQTTRLEIAGILKTDKALLTNISNNTGITLSAYLKMKCKEIIASAPPNMKTGDGIARYT
jgi:hypothetical protein